MNGLEIIEKLDEILFPEGNYDDWIPRSDVGYGNIPEDVQDEITEACGEWGYEQTAERQVGDTETQRTILHFKDHNVYIAFDGYYESWSGGSWDDASFYEAKPVERTYTDWVEVEYEGEESKEQE